MSYEICRNISLNEKKNIIKVCVACNNVYPHTFETVSYGNDSMSFKHKLKLLLSDVDGGNIQPYSSVTRFMYAFYKMKEKLNLDSYDSNLYYVMNYKYNATLYHFNDTKPHWNFKDSVITQEDIDSGAYEKCSDVYEWYVNKAEIEERRQTSEIIMDKAVEYFMKYYNENTSTDDKFVIMRGSVCIKPTKNGRYYTGYSKDFIDTYNKTDWMYDYKKAYVLSKLYDADVIKL